MFIIMEQAASKSITFTISFLSESLNFIISAFIHELYSIDKLDKNALQGRQIKRDGYDMCLLFSAWSNECIAHVSSSFCSQFPRSRCNRVYPKKHLP